MKEVKSSGDTWTEISRAAGTARRVVKCSKNDRATQRVRQSVMETCGARRDTLRLEWSSGLPSPRTFPKIQKQKQSNKKTQLQAKTEIEDQGYPRLLPPSPTPRALAHPSDRPPVAVSPPSRGRRGAAEIQAPRADSSEPSHSRGLPFPPGPQLPAQLGAVRLGSRYPPSVQLVPDPALMPFPSRSLLHPCISLFLHSPLARPLPPTPLPLLLLRLSVCRSVRPCPLPQPFPRPSPCPPAAVSKRLLSPPSRASKEQGREEEREGEEKKNQPSSIGNRCTYTSAGSRDGSRTTAAEQREAGRGGGGSWKGLLRCVDSFFFPSSSLPPALTPGRRGRRWKK